MLATNPSPRHADVVDEPAAKPVVSRFDVAARHILANFAAIMPLYSRHGCINGRDLVLIDQPPIACRPQLPIVAGFSENAECRTAPLGATSPGEASPLPRFLLLYALIYAAYGIEGPFLPALLAEHGMSAAAIGLLLAAGTAARLLSAPLAATIADRLGAPRLVLAGAILCSALVGCGFAMAGSFVALLLVSMLVSVTLAPINPLSDSLASAAANSRSAGRRGFDYGLVRGFGSAAFVCGAMIAGPLVAGAGLAAAVWVNAGLLAAAALAVSALPKSDGPTLRRAPHLAEGKRTEPGAFRALLAMPIFRRLLVVTGLVQGSHALYGAFATIRWQEAGISPEAIGMLWSVAVASEVVVFLGIGRPLLARIGPVGLAVLAATAGVVRWTIMANTALLPVQFGIQALHGLTFAALHLATMRLLVDNVPPRLSATAFGVHASLGPGLAGALFTLVAGPLYGTFGASGFWAMAALCVVALPASLMLKAGSAEPRLVRVDTAQEFGPEHRVASVA